MRLVRDGARPGPEGRAHLFYDQRHSALARAIVADLADAGFSIEARALAAGPFGVDIGIEVRFRAQ